MSVNSAPDFVWLSRFSARVLFLFQDPVQHPSLHVVVLSPCVPWSATASQSFLGSHDLESVEE